MQSQGMPPTPSDEKPEPQATRGFSGVKVRVLGRRLPVKKATRPVFGARVKVPLAKIEQPKTTHHSTDDILRRLIPDYKESSDGELLLKKVGEVQEAVDTQVVGQSLPFEETIPPTSNTLEAYFATTTPKKDSAHYSFEAVKKGKEEEDKSYFIKEIDPDNPISELECYASALVRHLIGKLAPVVRTAYGADKKLKYVVSRKLPWFVPLKDDPLTKNDLDPNTNDLSETIKKNLAMILAACFCIREDDAHGKNIGKFGKIDNDMALWHILYYFKTGTWPLSLDTQARKNSKENYKFTAEDIDNFPDLQKAKPHYWPTRTLGASSSTTAMSTVFALLSYIIKPVNQYTEEETQPFKDLKNDPIFIYHKFKTFLKFILTDIKFYEHLAYMHIRDELTMKDGKNLIQVMNNDQKDSIKELRDVLITMPSFQEFLNRDGTKALAEILDEINEANVILKNKISKINSHTASVRGDGIELCPADKRRLAKIPSYEKIKINLDIVKENYESIAVDALAKAQEAAPAAPAPSPM